MFSISYGIHTLSISLRNGFGFDIDLPKRRPVWILAEEGILEIAGFDGFEIRLPFILITFGIYFVEGEDEDES